MLVSPSRNPVRKTPYETQIKYHNLPVKRRQLRQKLKKYTKGGQRYKYAFVKKKISDKNLEKRRIHRDAYKDLTIISHFDYVIYTDKAHVNPLSIIQEEVLREEGHRYDTENIQERGQLTEVRFYIAG
jgi:transposase